MCVYRVIFLYTLVVHYQKYITIIYTYARVYVCIRVCMCVKISSIHHEADALLERGFLILL